MIFSCFRKKLRRYFKEEKKERSFPLNRKTAVPPTWTTRRWYLLQTSPQSWSYCLYEHKSSLTSQAKVYSMQYSMGWLWSADTFSRKQKWGGDVWLISWGTLPLPALHHSCQLPGIWRKLLDHNKQRLDHMDSSFLRLFPSRNTISELMLVSQLWEVRLSSKIHVIHFLLNYLPPWTYD